MTAAARIVWLDVETPKTHFTPVSAVRLHFLDRFDASDVATNHDSGKVAEPVGAKDLDRERVDHWVSVSAFNFLVQCLAQI